MGCDKCTKTPDLPEGVVKILVFANHDYMLKKFYDNFSGQFQIVHYGEYVELMGIFSEFIDNIATSKIFNQMELENISALVLEPHETPIFSSYRKAKSFSYWINLCYSKDLISILDNQSIVTYFQPIFDIRSNTVYAYECLSRGRKIDGSIMPPNIMFESARKTELIFNLDRLCRISALKNAKSKGLDANIFINFTPTSIYNPEYCLKDTIEAAVNLGYNFEKIVFEVVESERVENIEHLKSIFDFYKGMGFRVALDDVGSGYSSLNMLAKLKPDIIKIDMELIRNIHLDTAKKAIVNSLVLISHEIKALTLAEGIESEDELKVIRDLNIDLAQGYFLGKPAP
ncbi:MAG: EAL domain-containing protein [Calditerrivibrio sp.]|nr:EAL domain-containing protein [Calditerrivibrio sp.]